MKCLLISGAEDTGKTTIIKSVVDWLEYCGFDIDVRDLKINRKEKNDYFCIAENKEKKIKIIISTASDSKQIIKNFKEYCNKHLEEFEKEEKFEEKNIFIIAPIRNKENKILYGRLKKVISEILKINIEEGDIFLVNIETGNNKKLNINPNNGVDKSKNVFKIQLTEQYKEDNKITFYIATRVAIKLLNCLLSNCNLLQEDFFN